MYFECFFFWFNMFEVNLRTLHDPAKHMQDGSPSWHLCYPNRLFLTASPASPTFIRARRAAARTPRGDAPALERVGQILRRPVDAFCTNSMLRPPGLTWGSRLVSRDVRKNVFFFGFQTFFQVESWIAVFFLWLKRTSFLPYQAYFWHVTWHSHFEGVSLCLFEVNLHRVFSLMLDGIRQRALGYEGDWRISETVTELERIPWRQLDFRLLDNKSDPRRLTRKAAGETVGFS